jgi:hypothetical protein
MVFISLEREIGWLESHLDRQLLVTARIHRSIALIFNTMASEFRYMIGESRWKFRIFKQVNASKSHKKTRIMLATDVEMSE